MTERKTDCAPSTRIGEPRFEGLAHWSSPRTMVKKSTRVAAVSLRRCASASRAAARSGARNPGLDLAMQPRILPKRAKERPVANMRLQSL